MIFPEEDAMTEEPIILEARARARGGVADLGEAIRRAQKAAEQLAKTRLKNSGKTKEE